MDRARAYFSTAGALTTVVVSDTASFKDSLGNALPTSGPPYSLDLVIQCAFPGLSDHVVWQGMWVLLLGRGGDTHGLRVAAATSGKTRGSQRMIYCDRCHVSRAAESSGPARQTTFREAAVFFLSSALLGKGSYFVEEGRLKPYSTLTSWISSSGQR